MAAKTPKSKKAAAPKAPKKSAAAKPAKKAPPIADEDEEIAADLGEPEDEGDDDEDLDLDDEEGDEEEAPRAAKPAAPAAPAAVKKPAAPKPRTATTSDDAPAVVPARRLTPEAKARVNEMVKKGMSLTDALKAAASWETFVAPVKDEPAKLVQGRMGGGNEGPRHSNFAGETEPEESGGAEDEEPSGAGDED